MTDLRERLQTTLGNAYTLERELGGGGMSRVFVADETALGRKVVVKVLPPELAAGVSVDRFKREIQVAARLQHPHIVPVLSAGETDGLPFYTMPFVEGSSLRARLSNGALPITEAAGILKEVARALAYAHDRGLVHRDIKPDNVLLTGGSAVVTDFGIAKALSASRMEAAGSATLTAMGTSLGTPAYMAPEQAAGDPDTNHRADLYAFGCMAYEMLCGEQPFHGRTPHKLMAAHMGERPQPIVERRPDTPPVLADLVMQCLEKEPDQRPQSAADIARVLETVTSGGTQPSMPGVLLGGRGMLQKALFAWAGAFVLVAVLAKAAIVGIGLPDWVFPGAIVVMSLGLPVILFTGYVQRATHRAFTATPTLTPRGSPAPQGTMATMAIKVAPHMSWRRTTLGGIAAVGGFVALIGAWMAMRALGIGPAASLMAAGKLGERERVILADFRGEVDSSLRFTVTEALRADLSQSKSLDVLSANAVRETLRRMQRSSTTAVDYALAREIATREGIKAIIEGQVLAAGDRYLLSARLVAAQSSEQLATFSETADGLNDIIPAISRLTKSVRAKVGESMRRVQNAKTLDRVTTPSLEALQKYVAANRAIETEGDFARFEELMSEAIALDTGFAMAYRKLAVELGNRQMQRPRQEALLQKAYDNRDRLSETERYIMLGSYYMSGAQPDNDKAIAALESLLELDSVNVTALNNLASMYHDRSEFEKAAELARRAIVAQPTASVFFNNRFHNLMHLGQVEEAETTLALAAQNLPRNPQIPMLRGQLLFEQLKTDSAAEVLDSLAKARPNDLPTNRAVAFATANLREVNGRLGEFVRHMATARQLARQLGNPQALVNAILDSAYIASWYRNDRAAALRFVDRAAAHRVFDSLPPDQRPYRGLIDAYATSGRPDKAKALLQEYAALPDNQTPEAKRSLQGLQGLISRAEGRYDDAIREFQATDAGGCPECILPDVAMAYDLAGNADSAIALLTRFTEGRGIPLGPRASWLAHSLRRLGELHDAKGNADQAISAYARFVDLWKDADPELQPLVQKARDRMRELQRRRG